MENRQLSIPLYLNQRIVFDLLAIVEDGFSQLQTIRTTQSASTSTSKEASADVGIRNVFAFLNLGVKGSASKQGDKAAQKEMEEQRVFTPASLFSRLRDSLKENKLLLSIDDKENESKLKPGVFIEFSAVLRKNPLVAYMEGVIELFETGIFFQNFSSSTAEQPVQSGVKPGSKKKTQPIKKKEDKSTLNEMKKFANMLTQEGSLDLVTDSIGASELKAVVPVQMAYFADESPADIIDGDYVILGKVVRHIASKEGSINMLRSTPLAHFPEEALDSLSAAFADLGSQLTSLGEFTTQIPGPVIQIVPIAIFA